MKGAFTRDQSWRVWVPLAAAAQGPNQIVTLSCAASMTGPLAQRELVTRQRSEVFLGVR